jgi:hypothetical protein
MPHRSRHPWDARIGSAHMLALRWVPPAVVIELAFLEWDRHRLLRDARHECPAEATETTALRSVPLNESILLLTTLWDTKCWLSARVSLRLASCTSQQERSAA